MPIKRKSAFSAKSVAQEKSPSPAVSTPPSKSELTSNSKINSIGREKTKEGTEPATHSRAEIG